MFRAKGRMITTRTKHRDNRSLLIGAVFYRTKFEGILEKC